MTILETILLVVLTALVSYQTGRSIGMRRAVLTLMGQQSAPFWRRIRKAKPPTSL